MNGIYSAPLSAFQKAAEQGVERLAKTRGFDVNFDQEGLKEIYLIGAIYQLDLKIWIYVDEIEVKGNQVHRIFERPDFTDLDVMLTSFLLELDLIISDN